LIYNSNTGVASLRTGRHQSELMDDFTRMRTMSGIPRNDLRIVALEHEMIKNIPNANAHMLYLQNDKTDQFTTIRTVLRALDKGNSVLIFPAGKL